MEDTSLVRTGQRPRGRHRVLLRPPAIRKQKAHNDTVSGAVRRFAGAIDRPLLACRLALIAYPLGAVRLYLPKMAVPRQLDREIVKLPELRWLRMSFSGRSYLA